MLNNNKFYIRNATLDDLDCLVELEKEWPENVRATEAELALRIKKFVEGYFVAFDNAGMTASIISHPYYYSQDDLSNFKTWSGIVEKCYQSPIIYDETNALYIVSGTIKKTPYVTQLFNEGVELVIGLAKKMQKRYVVAGTLIPGFARYKETNANILAHEYVFTKSRGRFIDPLIEKYRRIGFHVPDQQHVFADYFPDENSNGYSALVVKDLFKND